MLYLDYAKPLTGGKYILNFFAESIEDLDSISHGQRFITKNGTDYGVPQPSSTVVITMPDKTKRTYVLDESLEWQEGGVDMDYSKLENAPIILANITEEGFVPEANTYYEHLGETTGDFVKGIIYLYDGTEYKAIDGSGSGGIQPDYNQNDSTAADYIKNRPFYEGLKEETLLEQTFTTSFQPVEGEPGFNFWETTENKISLKEGDAVNVLFNGTKYTLTVKKDFGSVLYIGNLYIFYKDKENTGEPFAVANTALSTLKDGTTIITEQPQTNATIKVYKSEDIIKTIDPKFIKDMYYETTTETQLFNGSIDINTGSSGSYKGTITPPIDLGEQGDKLEVVINNEKTYLDVNILGPIQQAGNVDKYGMAIVTQKIDSNTKETTITTKKSYTGANVSIKNLRTNIKQIPPKYISDVGYTMTIEIAPSDYTDSGISTAIKNYLTNNADALEKIKTVNSFDLVLNAEGTIFGFRFVDNFDSVTESLARSFVCLFYGQENFFNGNVYLYEKTLAISYQSDVEVNFKSGVVYDSNIKFGVAPVEDSFGNPYDFVGKLGFYTLDSDQGDMYIPGSNLVSLHEWITLAQQRADFAIPTPTKDTDLVDKKYVDGKAGGVVSKTSIKLNLSEFTYDETAQKFTLSQSAANTVSQIIQKQFELMGFCIAFLTVGETVFSSYQINFSNITPTTTAYLSFSNPLYDSEDLSSNFNVLIKPETTAQRICSDTSLFNIFVKNQGVLEFVLYSM